MVQLLHQSPGDAAAALGDLALREAARLQETEAEIDVTVTALRDAVRRARDLGPLAGLLDEEMSRASAPIASEPERAAEVATAFAALVAGAPSKASLSAFVEASFDAPASDRLAALVAAMSEAEIAEFFRTASLSVVRTTIEATNTVDL